MALAQALVVWPDVLLLDEPTNHLDLDSIRWLEDLLIDFGAAWSPSPTTGRFWTALPPASSSWMGPAALDTRQLPAAYRLQRKSSWRRKPSSMPRRQAAGAGRVWVRKGRGRRGSQSRIGRLEKLRETRAARRDVVGKVKMEVGTGGDSNYQGKIVAELQHVSKAFGDKVIAATSAPRCCAATRSVCWAPTARARPRCSR